jgi:hypothetical protein
MKLITLMAALLTTSFSFRVLPQISQKPVTPQPSHASIIQLIATPEKYYGKMVSVVGFLEIEKEDVRLFLGEEDYRRNLRDNGVAVDLKKEMIRDIEKLDAHYVLVVGVFQEKGLDGHGSITDVRECIPWPELTERRPRKPKE